MSRGSSRQSPFRSSAGRPDRVRQGGQHTGSSASRRGPATGSLSEAHSDIAFQGKTAYQGTFPGFRIIDLNNPSKPKEIVNYDDCRHPSGQGDVVVYGDVMTRSWDSASQNDMPPGGWPCGDTVVPPGQEGLHVFDVGNSTQPEVEAFIRLPCGSHTATGVPDPANDRLIVYSTPSNGNCDASTSSRSRSTTRRRRRTTTSSRRPT